MKGSLGACALALAAATTLAGCNDIFSSKSCASQGRLYQPGDSVVNTSACGGTCICGDDGKVQCPTIACTATCTVEGKVYQRGEQLPRTDCKSCWCGDDGQLTCTTAFCNPSVGLVECAFDATYTYGNDGGDAAYRDLVTLAPPASFSLQRTSYIVEPADVQCIPVLPACHDSVKIDAADITAELRHPDVVAALALSTPPFYGNDPRPVDGVAFKLQRADGRGFLVGDTCQANASCVPPPAGIQKLVEDLKGLQAQQLMDPTCAALRGPGG
ncbi:MAG TPA: hypothetical protein VFH68_20315 [Polyangia bacterium]|jgi:hypothetical protein|nr:hypothetical protein [Polyangia bacterium]